MLGRHELENYLFDKEVLQALCASKGVALDEARYDAAVSDVRMQDLKPVQQEIQAACAFQGTMPEFKRALGTVFDPELAVYQDMESSIFP